MGVSGLLTDGEEKGNKFLTCKISLISYNEELCTVTLKRLKKNMNHMTQPLSPSDISIFSTEISNF